MNELFLYSGGKLIGKLLSAAVPVQGHRLSVNNVIYRVEEVTMEFEKMGNAFCLKAITVVGWIVP